MATLCRTRTCSAVSLSVLVVGLPLLAAQVWAQSSASYQISRQSVDGGGGTAGSASYEVSSSIGQADAGEPLSSASFELRGGFQRAAVLPDALFADGFEN